MALVTIVSVTFNASKTIEETIISVISQTVKDFEFIVIDGGSTDGTLEIIYSYRNFISKIISENDFGIYDAMNKGILNSNSDFIFFLNSGDVLFPDTIEKFYNISNIFDQDIIYGNVSTKDKDQVIYFAEEINHMNMELPFCHQGVFVKSKLMKENLFNYNYKIASDYDFFLKQYIGNRKFLKTNILISQIDLNGISNVNTYLAVKEYLTIIFLNHKGAKKILFPLNYLFAKRKFLMYKFLIFTVGINNYNKIRQLFK